MDDLVAFLRARLDEDEEVARNATVGPWVTADHDDQVGMLEVRTVHEADIMIGYVADVATSDARHIVRHDPARVLREVAAKRRLLDLHGADRAHECPEPADAWGSRTGYERNCQSLRLLALPYADHPDFRPEWAPDA